MSADDDAIFDLEASGGEEVGLRPWPNRPAPRPGELLSGWLARAALANGLAPRSLFLALEQEYDLQEKVRFQLSGKSCEQSAWIDFHLPDKLAQALGRYLGVTRLALSAMRLGWVEREPAPETMSPIACLIRIDPELLRQEDLNHESDQTPGYLAFCPNCLTCPGWFPAWRRITLAQFCPIHSRRLLDRCPKCARSWLPHRCRDPRHLALCTWCGCSFEDLKRPWRGEVGAVDIWRAMRMEAALPLFAQRLLAERSLSQKARRAWLDAAIKKFKGLTLCNPKVELRDLLTAYVSVMDRRQGCLE